MKIKGKPTRKTMKVAEKGKMKIKSAAGDKLVAKKSSKTKLLLKKKKEPKFLKTKPVHAMSDGFEDDDDSSAGEEELEVPKASKRKNLHEDSDDADEETEDGNVAAVKKKKKSLKKPVSHKSELEKLKEVDPDFYKYLEENDRDLLDFRDVSDDDEGDDGQVHQLPDKLEVASDESDFEAEGEEVVEKGSGYITLKRVEEWRAKIQTDKSNQTLREVLEAFQAALQCVVPENERVPCQYVVEGAAVFNAVLRLCVVEVQPSLRLVLKLPMGSKQSPSTSKNWSKVRAMLRTYLLDLTKLCQVTSPGMLSVLLKHVHQMAPYAVCFSNIASRLLTRLVGLWTSEADVVRVLSFLCLLRIANLKRVLLGHILKKMYLAFVRNSKFVSPNSLPGLNFLRQSLAEMFALDPSLSYQHAFLYIRQLSIHLRNAVTLNKKESFQAVYNWQFVQSLQLWAELLSLVPQDSPLAGLIYPLVQITLGTIKLIPSSQYYPLRFHCIKFMLGLMEKRGVFIPVLPLLLEVLKDFDFNRKHSKVSMKPLSLSCILRCTKLQMQENGFKDAVIDSVCALMLEAFTVEAYRLSFPDTVVPAVIQLKQFLKTCKVSKYCKQVKAVLDKVVENAKAVELERSKANIRLDDARGIAAVEAGLRAKGTPLMTYFATWQKLHLQQEARKITDTEAIGDSYKLPTLYKFDKKQSRDREGPVELFPSDDDSDDPGNLLGDDNDDEVVAKRSGKKKPEQKKKKKLQPSAVTAEPTVRVPSDWPELDAGDIIEDLEISDLE